MFKDPAQSNAEPVADIDLAIDKVSMFRLERMDDGVIWIRLYRETGDDKVIWLNSSSAITATVDDDKARAALAQFDAEPKQDRLNGDRLIPFDRDTGGRFVREAWVRWARTQPNPKPSWLVPYDELSEPNKEADRQIAEAVARWTLIHDATALAQSDAEPVGWQYREPGGEWVTGDAATDIYYRTHKYEIRRLYAAPPRPDVSAGLIEAAEMAEKEARAGWAVSSLRDFAIKLRARAADRSGK